MPDVISGVIIALADAQLMFRVGKVTKKSRTSKEIREKVCDLAKKVYFCGMFLITKPIVPTIYMPCNDCRWYIEPENEHERWACSFPGKCITPDGHKSAYFSKSWLSG